jgi:hypothetical protein
MNHLLGMRATPDLPDSMTPKFFRDAAHEARRNASSMFPDSAMKCYAIAALLAQAETYDRISEAEWTFEGLMGECIRRQAQLAELYGVKP